LEGENENFTKDPKTKSKIKKIRTKVEIHINKRTTLRF
jgi:hypothetical protein